MNGYLRSLAERALGIASGVRPARGPPSFADGPSQPRTIAAPAEYAETPAAPLDRFDGTERQGDTAPSDVAAAAPIGEPDDTPTSKPITPQHRRLAPLADAHRDDIPANTISHHADPARDPRPAPSAEPDAPARRDFARPVALEQAERSIADDRARGFQRGEIALAEDAPPLEFPGRVRPAPRTAVTPRITTRLARDRSVDPTQPRLQAPSPAPDVHIHIGRVELTAVTPAAPARREPAANAKKPMSLEEYLRRRSGRPS